MARFRDAVAGPLRGRRGALSEADLQALGAKLAPCIAWQGRKAGALVEALGIDRIRAIRAGPSRAAIAALIAEDAALAPEFESVAAVDTLARSVRDQIGRAS